MTSIRLYAFLLFLLGCGTLVAQNSWMNGFGGAANDEGRDIVRFLDDYISAGYFGGSCPFGDTLIHAAGGSDAYIMRCSDDGTIQWVKQFGDSGNDRGVALDVDAAGNAFLVGTFFGFTEIDGTPYNTGDEEAEIFLVKLAPDGAVLWSQTCGGPDEDVAYDIHCTPDGGAVITGQFRGLFEYGSESLAGTPYGALYDEDGPSLDLFIAKLDGDGNWLWAKQGSTPSDARGLAITGSDSNLFLTGQFSDTLTLTSEIPNEISNATFIAGLDNEGNELWFTKISAGFTQANDILYHEDHVYLLGDFTQQLSIFEVPAVFISAEYDQNYFLTAFTESGSLDWYLIEGSENPVQARAMDISEDGVLEVGGHFRCRMDGFAEDADSPLWYSLDDWDAFLTGHDLDGNRLWERHLGGLGVNKCFGIASDESAGFPAFLGYTTNSAIYRGQPESFTADSTLSVYCDEWPLPYCGDPEYHRYTRFGAIGGSDIVLSRTDLLATDVIDPFLRLDSGCDLEVPGIYIDLGWQLCEASEQDTVKCCSSACNLYSKPPIHPKMTDYNYLYEWSTGSTEEFTETTSGEGWYWCEISLPGGCLSWTDSVYVDFVVPECLSFSDELGVNASSCAPDTVSICGLDELLLWAEIPGGTVTSWGSIGIPVSPITELSSDSVLVINSDTFTAYGIDGNGCAVSGEIQVQLGQMLVDLDAQLAIVLSDGEDDIGVIDGDSLDFCDAQELDVIIWDLLDSELIGLNVNSTVVGTLDGFDFFNSSIEGSLVGEYDHPHIHEGFVLQSGDYSFTAYVEYFNSEPCPIEVQYDTLHMSFHLEIVDTPPLEVSGIGPICPGDCLEIVFTDLDSIYASYGSITYQAPTHDTVLVCNPGFSGFDYTRTAGDCVVEGSWSEYFVAFQPPTITALPDHYVICPNDSVLLSAPEGIAYQWYGALGEPIGNQQEFWVTSPGWFSVGVTNEDGCYLESIITETFEYNSPYVDFTPSGDLCFEGEVEITVITNESAGIVWEAPLTGNNLNQVVTDPGVYSVTVDFCNEVTSFSAEVFDTPVSADIQTASVLLCTSDSVLLEGPSDLFAYAWSNGSGEASTYASSEGWTVLTTTNAVGCTASDSLELTAQESVQPEALPSWACLNEAFTLSANSTHPLYWSLTPGSSDTLSTELTFDHPGISESTTFYVQYPDGTCGALIDSVSIAILDGGIITSDTSACLPSSLTLQAFSTLADALVEWSPSSQVAIPNSLSTSITSDNTSVYTLQLSDENGCLITDEVEITQFSEVTVLPEDTSFCEGGVLELEVNWPLDYIIEWSDGQTGNPSFWTTTTPIEVTVTSPDGCISQDEMQLTVLETPPSILPSDTSFCEGEVLQLVGGGPGYSYQWNTGATTAIIEVNEPGIYSLETSNLQCSINAAIEVLQGAAPQDELLQISRICFDLPPYEVALDAGNSGSTFAWSSGGEEQVEFVDSEGYFEVLITSPDGCADSYEIEVTEFCEATLYVPNGFTPDGDGINDVWQVVATNLIDFHVLVFNRWGEVVFESTNADDVWTGNDQGGEHFVPNGTYAYRINASWEDAAGLPEPHTQSGHITIVR